MREKYLFFLFTIHVILIFGLSLEKTYSMPNSKNNQYNIGYEKGCNEGRDGKSPDLTQYDRADGFSNHTIDYNTGYVDGYNDCSPSQQIDPFLD